MASFTVNVNGKNFTFEAASADEAHNMAMAEAGKGEATRGVESVGTGVRQAAEGTLGQAGSGGSMLGGAARWGAQQANKILPESLQTNPNAVGQGVANVADPVIKQFTPATGMANVAAALQRLGVIGPDTAQGVSTVVAPTVQQVHQATSAVAPQGLQEATTQQPQGRVDEALQLLGNFLGLGGAGAKTGPIGTTVKAAVPAAAVEGSDVLTDAWVKEGKISPETQTAIKTLVGMGAASGTAAGMGAAERAVSKSAAAGKVGSTSQAMQAVYDGLIADGHTPASARQAMQQLGIDATMMDVGENMTQLGIKSATSPGAGQAAIKRELKGREERTGARLQEAKVNALGQPVNRETIMADFKQRGQDIGEQYPAAKQNQARPADTQSIADELDSELASARGSMRGALAKVRRSLDIPDAKGQLDPSAEGLHAMRMELDNQIAKATPGSPEYSRLNYYRKQVDAELKASAPDIKALDEQYRGVSKEREAFETGEAALKKGGAPGEVKSPEEFKGAWDRMTGPERSQALSGASRHIDETLGLTDRERSRLKTVLGGEWNEGKLRTMIGDEKTQALMDALGREDTFKATLQRVVYGSRTLEGLDAEKPSLTKGVGSAGIGGVAGGGATGAATAMGVQTLRNMLARLTSSPDKANALKSDIGKLLVSKRPDDVFRALEIFAKNQPTGSKLPPAALAALLQRQQDLGNR